MKKRTVLVIFLFAMTAGAVWLSIAVSWSGCTLGPGQLVDLATGRQTPSAPARPEHWAAPLDRPGLPNLHRVTEALYRGAQPTGEGFRQLRNMGIRTVVNLRDMHDDAGVTDEPMVLKRIRFTTWWERQDQVVEFLRIVTDSNNSPVFVHCLHGSDRTGMMLAAYRIVVQGWSKDEAIREMTEGGYGFHAGWANLIRFIRDMDVQKVRREAGL